jgi:hypothetical protein
VTWTVVGELKVHESVALPEPVTLAGETVQEVLFVLKWTSPTKPLTAPTAMFEIPAFPAFRVTGVGLPVKVKSVTVNVTVAE